MYYFQIVIALAAWICVCRGQNPNTTPVPSPSNYPFMASVQRLGAQERTGIILDASHILTTARRIETIYYRDYRVFVGQLDWADNDEAVSQVRNVSQLVRHPDYCDREEDSLANNVLILKLSDPLELSDLVKPVKLPELFSPITGESGVVVGWKNDNSTTALHELQSIPLLDPTTCRSFLGRHKYRAAHLCAGYVRPDGTASDGKSFDFNAGSILVCPQDEETICGLLSYAPDPPICQSPANDLGYPIIFTQISMYSDWIQSVLDRPLSTTTNPPTSVL